VVIAAVIAAGAVAIAAAAVVIAVAVAASAVARDEAMKSSEAELKVSVLRPGLASLPRYASEGAAGLDLCAALEAPLTLLPLSRAAVPTGLAIELPEGCEGQVRPRSGLALKHGVTVLNAPGTIDADYRGELQVLLVNIGAEPHVIQPGDRIAQLIVAPVLAVQVVEAEQLSSSARGRGGFGSTGR
jgi:dUTP pyrophosphatase